MRRVQLVLLIIMMAATALVVDACKECTCKNYAAETDEATYCRFHRDAVWDYVDQATDTAQMKVQVTRLETLYKAVDDCGDMNCIVIEIQADSIAPGFATIFVSANADAASEVDAAGFDQRKVLLCGLMHGIIDWRERLGMEAR